MVLSVSVVQEQERNTMNCEQVSDLLGPFHDGELFPDSASGVAGHLARCPECASKASSLRDLSEFIKRVGPARAPDGLFDRIATEADRLTVTSRSSPRLTRLLSRVAAGFLGAFIVGVAWTSGTAALSGLSPQRAGTAESPIARLFREATSSLGRQGTLNEDILRLQSHPEGRLMSRVMAEGRDR